MGAVSLIVQVMEALNRSLDGVNSVIEGYELKLLAKNKVIEAMEKRVDNYKQLIEARRRHVQKLEEPCMFQQQALQQPHMHAPSQKARN